jgi:hypothetical protein
MVFEDTSEQTATLVPKAFGAQPALKCARAAVAELAEQILELVFAITTQALVTGEDRTVKLVQRDSSEQVAIVETSASILLLAPCTRLQREISPESSAPSSPPSLLEDCTSADILLFASRQLKPVISTKSLNSLRRPLSVMSISVLLMSPSRGRMLA